MAYTFGDNQRAGARLRRLAEMYEAESRDLMLRSGANGVRLAVDLGCGPGWSTLLLRDTLRPARTVGLDASAAYVAEARERHGAAGIEFEVHDIVREPFPVGAPDFLFCRFLLAHLRNLGEVLATWARAAAPGAYLAIHETETLQAGHPALRRYYVMLGEMQRHHGQELHVGAVLEASIAGSGWRVAESRCVPLEKRGAAMAGLHLANLRTWREDEYARQAFEAAEMGELEEALERIASGREDGGVVVNGARQIVARRE